MTQRRETPEAKFHDDPDQFIVPHLLRELKNECTCGVCELLREAVEEGFKAPAAASASVIAEMESLVETWRAQEREARELLQDRAATLSDHAYLQQLGLIMACAKHADDLSGLLSRLQKGEQP